MAQDPREKVRELCETDVEAALRFARNIQFRWYRTQALATVALYISPKARFLKIVEDALQAAHESGEPNRIVSCGAWVVSAICKRTDVDPLPFVEGLLGTIKIEPNPVRRAHALLLLFDATYRSRRLRSAVLPHLLRDCQEMNSWRRPLILREIALIVAPDDPELANKVLGMFEDGRVKRKTLEMIEKGEWLGPHEFFPYFTKRPT